MRHWAGTLQSGWFYQRRHNATHAQKHPFTYLSSAPSNQTFPSRFQTRVRFPADVMTWRNHGGQGHRVKDVGGGERSPVTVAGIAALFFCCSITATIALGVFCRKRNMVFPLENKVYQCRTWFFHRRTCLSNGEHCLAT